jgi:hypothetical protein
MIPEQIATQHGSTWREVDLRRHRATYALLLLLAGCFGVTVLVFHPGYITVDARYVYADAQAWHFGDWQSPAMGALWRIIDPIAPGALSMFLLTATLYWLAFGALAFIALHRSTWLGLATPLLAFLPPAFFFVGMIWRDVQFAVMWLAAGVLVFAAAERGRHIRLPAQAVALALIAFGVLLRPNAIIAAPLLAAYAISPACFAFKRAAIVFLPAAALFYALVPLVYYGLLTADRQNPLHSILVFDLGGITHFSGDNAFPVQWNAQETALLKSKCYDPVRWDTYWHVTPCPFVMQRLERPDDVIFGKSRLVRAWRHAVLVHPLSYLAHRTAFMWQLLARANLVLPVWDWADPGASYGHNPYFAPVLRLHDILAAGLLFRPGLWLLLAAATGAASWRRRGTPSGAFAVGVTSCAAVYVMSFFVLGVAADFRYAYWCVLATVAGAVAAVISRLEARAGPDAGFPRAASGRAGSA